MDVHRNLVEKVANGCPFTDVEWETLRALYDAQLEYIDTFLGELFGRIQPMDDEIIFRTPIPNCWSRSGLNSTPGSRHMNRLIRILVSRTRNSRQQQNHDS